MSGDKPAEWGGTRQMKPDLPDELAIGYSTWRLLELVGLGIIMTLLCGAVVFLIPVKGVLQLVVGYAGIVFFGAATCTAVWKLVTAKAPVLFINRTGIRDLRIADQWIVWDAVTDLRITRVRSQKFVVLKVSPALEELLFASIFKRMMQGANRALSVDGIVISPTGLSIRADALFEACRFYRAAEFSSAGGRSRRRTATKF
jgi:hypothetical protein